ncbi:MAG: hypothetical protein J5922_04875 [Clostridia bacterium]|nr:hypothetical protein [Clostridia bacterium]
MKEKIYTIPINETFDKIAEDNSIGCPLCALYREVEINETETILGGAMMVPEIRQKTNVEGFCRTHYDMMFESGGKLALGLILESHLDTLKDDLKNSFSLMPAGSKQEKRISELQHSCYICSRVNATFEKMLENTVLLWQDEKEFREKFSKMPYFCLDHYKALIETAKRELPKKVFADFYEALSAIENGYLAKLGGDISWFCKKFDYRYENEPWYDSKDAIERSFKFLSGDLHKITKKPGQN